MGCVPGMIPKENRSVRRRVINNMNLNLLVSFVLFVMAIVYTDKKTQKI